MRVFIRFTITELHPSSERPRGVFSAIYALEREGRLEPYEVEWFREVERWFNANLRAPERLSTSKRPDAQARALSWFKDSAIEHVSRMRELVEILRHKDVVVEELRTEKPGYIVYEDEFQVAAVPFGGTG